MPVSFKTTGILLTILVAAIVLNLGVLSLDDPNPSIAAASGDQIEATEVSVTATSSVATTLTTVGELPAGSEATAARSSGSDSNRSAGGATDTMAAAEPELQTSSPDPSITTAPSTSTVSSTLSSTSALSSTSTGPPTPEPATEYLTYDFPGVASEIVIALHDGRHLEFWSATPESGYAYRVDDDRSDKIKIKFQRLSDGEEAEFELEREDGQLEVERER